LASKNTFQKNSGKYFSKCEFIFEEYLLKIGFENVNFMFQKILSENKFQKNILWNIKITEKGFP